MKLSARGYKKLIGFEGFRDKAYIPIKGDVWTLGYGFTEGVKQGDTITRAKADARLGRELEAYESAVLTATGGKVNQSQFDALVSFAWNVGAQGMTKSSVIRAHNRGDYQAAARAFALWNKSKGKVIPGLTQRRAAEAAMYLETDDVEPMPQRVDPESTMADSPINKAGVVAGGTAAVAATSQVINTLNDLKESVTGLGDWLVPALLVVTIAAAGFIVWQRIAQRRGGWA